MQNFVVVNETYIIGSAHRHRIILFYVRTSATQLQLRTIRGNTATTQVNSFYEKLYERRDVEDCEISQMVTEIPHSNDEEAERIEGEITLNEASMALRNMKHSKSPGTDGFNAEFFFKVFWS